MGFGKFHVCLAVQLFSLEFDKLGVLQSAYVPHHHTVSPFLKAVLWYFLVRPFLFLWLSVDPVYSQELLSIPQFPPQFLVLASFLAQQV